MGKNMITFHFTDGETEAPKTLMDKPRVWKVRNRTRPPMPSPPPTRCQVSFWIQVPLSAVTLPH